VISWLISESSKLNILKAFHLTISLLFYLGVMTRFRLAIDRIVAG